MVYFKDRVIHVKTFNEFMLVVGVLKSYCLAHAKSYNLKYLSGIHEAYIDYSKHASINN